MTGGNYRITAPASKHQAKEPLRASGAAPSAERPNALRSSPCAAMSGAFGAFCPPQGGNDSRMMAFLSPGERIATGVVGNRRARPFGEEIEDELGVATARRG